ncbi:MAG: ATP-binding cassette domain-containing protein [Desulfovibrionaceae bacterium]
MLDQPILSVRALSYAPSEGETLLRDVNLDIEAGGFYVVKGPSGAGKSTLLRLLCRLILPSSGAILLRGRPVNRIPAPELRSRVLYLHQSPLMVEGGVEDNILLPFTFKANAALERPGRERLLELMRELRLDGVDLDRPADKLSVGQKQRVCLLRALVLSPDILLLDEPTSALDQDNAAVVLDRIAWLHREKGQTILLVTHGTQVIPVDNLRTLSVRNGTARIE